MSTNERIDLSQFYGATPGPWNTVTEDSGDILIVQPSLRVGDPFEYYVAQVVTGGLRKTYLTNANLIAAAPALLAELKLHRAREAKVRELVEAASAGFIALGRLGGNHTKGTLGKSETQERKDWLRLRDALAALQESQS